MLHELCSAGESSKLKDFLSDLRDERGEDDQGLNSILDARNAQRYTPLHTAVFCRDIESVRVLLDFGADINLKCHGMPCLHVALFTLVQPDGETFGTQCFHLLLERGANVAAKDDRGFTAVHWAVAFNLPLLVTAALAASKNESLVNANPKITGITALHMAADYDAVDTASILIERGANLDAVTASSRMTPLHVAGLKGSLMVWKRLIEAGADEHVIDAIGRTPAELKRRCEANRSGSAQVTAIVAHEFCSVHFTCPPSSAHTGSAPPENMRRLQLLVDQKMGSLRGADIASKLKWISQHEVGPAALSDVLRVHEWSFIRYLQAQCEAIESFDAEDEVNGLGHLDGDTTISKGTFQAALAAAGAVCKAVDKVAAGETRNAFCPIRPPGHHAGPRGVVKGEIEASDSHGFCILNNVSIGAAYAMNMYRDIIKKVAIIDFDVHHGNGTEETVRWLKPSVEHMEISSDVCFGVLQRPKYKPWFDSNDAENVLFVSVHGYGPRDRLPPGYDAHRLGVRPPSFYPGSGETKFPTRLKGRSVKPEIARENEEAKENSFETAPVDDAMETNDIHRKEDNDTDADNEGQSENNDADEEDDDSSLDLDEMMAMHRSMQSSSSADRIFESLRSKQVMFSSYSKDADQFREGILNFSPDFTGPSAMRTAISTLPHSSDLNALPPLILDIGMPLPDLDPDSDPSLRNFGGKSLCEFSYRIQWRQYFREEIFPRLMEFSPDFIFISAGFDAHKKDTLNSGYIALVEEDFDWVTQHLVEIANSCCDGRIVSVLEGGYQLHGEYCSAFAQSAKSHVRALAQGGSVARKFDVGECIAMTKLEREHLENLEHARRVEITRRERERLMEQRRAEVTNEAVSHAPPHPQEEIVEVTASAKKRRRTTVDYEALDRKLREENGAAT